MVDTLPGREVQGAHPLRDRRRHLHRLPRCASGHAPRQAITASARAHAIDQGVHQMRRCGRLPIRRLRVVDGHSWRWKEAADEPPMYQDTSSEHRRPLAFRLRAGRHRPGCRPPRGGRHPGAVPPGGPRPRGRLWSLPVEVEGLTNGWPPAPPGWRMARPSRPRPPARARPPRELPRPTLSDHDSYCEAPCTLACPAGVDVPGVLRRPRLRPPPGRPALVRESFLCPVCAAGSARTTARRSAGGVVDEPIAVTTCTAGRRSAARLQRPGASAGPRGDARDRRRRPGRPVRRVVPDVWPGTRSPSSRLATSRAALLRYGIPEFRLPGKVARRRNCEPLWDAGVRFVGESELGYEVDPDGLCSTPGSTRSIISVGNWRGVASRHPGRRRRPERPRAAQACARGPGREVHPARSSSSATASPRSTSPARRCAQGRQRGRRHRPARGRRHPGRRPRPRRRPRGGRQGRVRRPDQEGQDQGRQGAGRRVRPRRAREGPPQGAPRLALRGRPRRPSSWRPATRPGSATAPTTCRWPTRGSSPTTTPAARRKKACSPPATRSPALGLVDPCGGRRQARGSGRRCLAAGRGPSTNSRKKMAALQQTVPTWEQLAVEAMNWAIMASAWSIATRSGSRWE